MPSHDPTHCRERLATLMAEENAQLAALEGLLTHEYGMLQARDVEGLDKSGTRRQQCIAEILRIEDERRELCLTHGAGDAPDGLRNLLAWCDPTGLLRPALQEYGELTGRCREQNDRNGMLVNARLQSVSSMSNVLGGGASDGRTYGPGSGSRGGPASGYGRKLTTRA